MHNSASTFYLVFAEFGERFTTPLTSFLKKRGVELKHYIEKKFNIRPSNQIIIHKSGKLINDETSLEGLLKEKMKLFVFNKELHSTNQINIKRTQSLINDLLGEPVKGKRDFFQEFANQFKGQSLFNVLHVLADSFQEIQALYNTALDERKLVKYLYKNIEFQKKGEKVVKCNCEKHFLQTKQEVNDNLERFLKNNDSYKESLIKVESLYERLNEYQTTMPCFHSKNINTFQDFFKREHIEKWKSRFEKIQRQFEIKLTDLKTLFDHYSLKDILDNLQTNIELEKFQNFGKNRSLGDELKQIKDELEIVFFTHLNKLEEAKRDYKQFFESKKTFLKNLIEKLQRIKITLQDSKEKNIESIQIFISKVSKLQEEIHIKMRNALKILEHLNRQLEKESFFVRFLGNFPKFYEECLREQHRRNEFSKILMSQNEILLKMVLFERERQRSFFREALLGEMEFCPKGFFSGLIADDDSIEFYLNSLKLALGKQLDENKIDSLNTNYEMQIDENPPEGFLNDEYLNEIEKLKQTISHLQSQIKDPSEEQKALVEKLSEELSNKNLELSTHEKIIQELKENLQEEIKRKNKAVEGIQNFLSSQLETFQQEKEILKRESENYKNLFESKKSFNEEELIKTIENMRREMEKINSEKENYKSLFESRKQTKEEELNQTIDFFKIENVKLGDQILKVCHELKRKDEIWLKVLKQNIIPNFNSYCELNLTKIKTHFDTKITELAQKQGRFLKFIEGLLIKNLGTTRLRISNLKGEIKTQNHIIKAFDTEKQLLVGRLKQKVSIDIFSMNIGDSLIFRIEKPRQRETLLIALTKLEGLKMKCFGISRNISNFAKSPASFFIAKIFKFIEENNLKAKFYNIMKEVEGPNFDREIEIILVDVEITGEIV